MLNFIVDYKTFFEQHAKKDTRKFLSTGQGSKNLAFEIISVQYEKSFSQ
jgi:hypothetical protein